MSCAESAPTPAPAPVVVPPVGAAEAVILREKKDMELSAREETCLVREPNEASAVVAEGLASGPLTPAATPPRRSRSLGRSLARPLALLLARPRHSPRKRCSLYSLGRDLRAVASSSATVFE